MKITDSRIRSTRPVDEGEEVLLSKSPDRILFVGSKNLGYRVLEELYRVATHRVCGVVTYDDSDDPRSAFDELHQFSAAADIKLHTLDNPGGLSAVIRELSPSCVLLCGWYWIVDNETIGLVPNGVYALHASLLPAYRGHAPLVWAILRGETETGVTLFAVDPGVDTGPVIGQASFPIGSQDHIADVIEHATKAACRLIAYHGLEILSGGAQPQPQQRNGVSYGTRRTAGDGKIDWTLSALEIRNFVRAQSYPYPGAFVQMDASSRVFVWDCEIVTGARGGVPGETGPANGPNRIVFCSDGAIEITVCSTESRGEVNSATVIPRDHRLV